MKFLLNVNMPPSLGELLAGQGHSFRCAARIGLERASDLAIVATARENHETILTHDLDYGALLVFSGENSPSVVIFRVQPMTSPAMRDAMLDNWSEISGPLENGAIVIVDKHGLRIRGLPFASAKA